MEELIDDYLNPSFLTLKPSFLTLKPSCKPATNKVCCVVFMHISNAVTFMHI